MYYIYSLKKEGNIVYVGRTKNVKKRLYEHKRKKDFDSYEILYETTDLEKAKTLEDHFIMKNDPKYNKCLNSGGHYISIKEETDGKMYNIPLLLELMFKYNVKPVFNDKYQNSLIHTILRESEIKLNG